MTSGTELVAKLRYPRGLFGGCADSGDFGAGHYVRTALLALPGVGGARQRLRGSRWPPPDPLGGQHLNLPWEGVLGRGALLLPLPGSGGGGSGSGARVRVWRPERGSVPGEKSRGQKVRSTKTGGVERVSTGAGGHLSVTSSPGLPRARSQRAFFDGSQHAPLPPGPSAQPFRARL